MLHVVEHFFAHAGRAKHAIGLYLRVWFKADSPWLDILREHAGAWRASCDPCRSTPRLPLGNHFL